LVHWLLGWSYSQPSQIAASTHVTGSGCLIMPAPALVRVQFREVRAAAVTHSTTGGRAVTGRRHNDAMTNATIWLTGDPEADRLLSEDDNALLIGMVLDQQVPMEKAFSGPLVIAQRWAGNSMGQDRGDERGRFRGALLGATGHSPLSCRHGKARTPALSGADRGLPRSGAEHLEAMRRPAMR
jgi:hypothetical protein